MARPDPRNGQVVRYEYLWRSEEHQGSSEAEKTRPCAVVVVLSPQDGAPQRVMVCAITHTQPRPPSAGVEIPLEAKKRAGLDNNPSWIIISEVNQVKWSDRRFKQTLGGQWLYGVLPEEVMVAVRQAILERIRANKMDVINREQIDERIAGGSRTS